MKNKNKEKSGIGLLTSRKMHNVIFMTSALKAASRLPPTPYAYHPSPPNDCLIWPHFYFSSFQIFVCCKFALLLFPLF